MPTESTVDYLYGDQIPSDALSTELSELLGDTPVILAAPSPDTNSTVTSNDLLTFVGSGAHDFVAYRTGDYTSYCIYPVRISSDGLVTGTDCDTIEIYNRSGSLYSLLAHPMFTLTRLVRISRFGTPPRPEAHWIICRLTC